MFNKSTLPTSFTTYSADDVTSSTGSQPDGLENKIMFAVYIVTSVAIAGLVCLGFHYICKKLNVLQTEQYKNELMILRVDQILPRLCSNLL